MSSSMIIAGVSTVSIETLACKWKQYKSMEINWRKHNNLQKIDPIKFIRVVENIASLAINEHGKASKTDIK
jgi:hypothetical protein